jgi:hypothetical protein
MLNDFFKEKKLINGLARIEKQHEKFKKTTKYKNLTAKEKWEEDQCYYQVDYGPVWEELEELKTRKLLAKASMLSIPFPNHWADKEEKYWNKSAYGEHYLNIHGKHEIIKAIREEEKALNEARIWWLPLFSALISALSVLLGVILGVSIK